MDQATVSQDEVDSLLQGIADEGTSDVAADAAPLAGGDAPDAVPAARRATDGAASDCDLTRQARIAPADMPGLEAIHKRFVLELQGGLLRFSQKGADVTASPVEVQTYGDFLESIGTPTNANLVTLQPLGGHGLVVCEPGLICGLVDALFGGNGRYPSGLEGRSFSATEQRIIVRLVEVVATAYASAWAAVHPFEIVYRRSETLPQFMNLARRSDTVVVSRYAISCAGASGTLHLCFPYAGLEPVHSALYAPPRTDAAPLDAGWSERLTREIQCAEVDLIAELAQTSATVEQLLALRPGDFMEVELSPSIRAVVDGVPVFQCHYGTSNGKNAIKIDQPVSSPITDWLGAPHV